MNITDFIPGADLLKVGMGIIDKIIPDPNAKAAAQLELLKQEQAGALEGVKVQMSAIIAEANSADPWTSRARPSFMYVIYIMVLMSVPMGFLAAFKPDMAAAVALGMKSWLAAVPDSLWALFGAGYLGYTGMRGVEKIKGAS
jgi:hypothetical protein